MINSLCHWLYRHWNQYSSHCRLRVYSHNNSVCEGQRGLYQQCGKYIFFQKKRRGFNKDTTSVFKLFCKKTLVTWNCGILTETQICQWQNPSSWMLSFVVIQNQMQCLLSNSLTLFLFIFYLFLGVLGPVLFQTVSRLPDCSGLESWCWRYFTHSAVTWPTAASWSAAGSKATTLLLCWQWFTIPLSLDRSNGTSSRWVQQQNDPLDFQKLWLQT